MEAAVGKSQRKFGGVHAMEWLLVADIVEKSLFGVAMENFWSW
jgi:hypothetical protein